MGALAIVCAFATTAAATPMVAVELSVDAGIVGVDSTSNGGSVQLSSASQPVTGLGSYSGSAFANAGFGTLRASATLDFTDHDLLGVSPLRSRGRAEFEDTLVFDSAGMSGEAGFVEISWALTGDGVASADTASSGFFASALATLNLQIGGSNLTVAYRNQSNGVLVDPAREGSFLIPVVFGAGVAVTSSLTAQATTFSNQADASANGFVRTSFDNSAGITGFRAFDSEMDELDFDLSSESGQFALFVVPEPGTALLIGLGLGLVGWTRAGRRT